MGGERRGVGGRRDGEFYRPSETRQTIEGQDKRPFPSVFWRFQIELC